MRNIIGIIGASLSVVALPLLAQATTLIDTLNFFNRVLNGLVGMFITVAIIVFFWGLIKYLASGGEDKAAGLQIMMYGVITIFVMVSIWGIIRLLQGTFGVAGGTGMAPAAVPSTIQN